ncbi:kinase-like domain-containing protein [Dactylonectria macrodidyma]|uniref:Kinase-like domain-containing protein n=1 Tax=Dactylonectria macrodidyma TaxID=307937 RepID=A0A9P9FP46_9HYPO|nr:kinase-like domain-containing protein [Dactylonectria macrodidyma]
MSHPSQKSQDSGQRPQRQLHQQNSLPDLVRDSKLNTRFLPDGTTQHTVYVTPGHASRRRKTRVEETWQRECELGNGTFGHVWLERCRSGPSTGSVRAIKEMQLDPSMRVDYSRELEAMTKFSHDKYVDCFVKCFGWFMSENLVFIAMEHLEHGDLQKYLHQPFPEEQAKEITTQLTEGLTHMHDNGFAHRDLKPANILVYKPGPNWWVKIGDFGISKRAEEENTALRTLIGTEGYLAPEIIGFTFTQDSPESDAFSYTFAVDMWALGELTFRMVAQRPAFPNRQDLFNCVVRGYAFPTKALETVGASSDCCDFILKSMIADPGKRLTAYEASLHSWLQISRPSSRSSSTTSKRNPAAPTISSDPPPAQNKAPPPMPSYPPALSPVPEGWTIQFSQEYQRWFYFEAATGRSQWEAPSMRNGHLVATPPNPQAQLETPFENTAQWSTAPQENQYSQMASSFDNTAQWSTGIQQPQNPHLTSSSDYTARQSGGLGQANQHTQSISSFENTAQWSTGFQRPTNPQVVEEKTQELSPRRDHSGDADQTVKAGFLTSSKQTEEQKKQKEFEEWLADRPRRMKEAAIRREKQESRKLKTTNQPDNSHEQEPKRSRNTSQRDGSLEREREQKPRVEQSTSPELDYFISKLSMPIKTAHEQNFQDWLADKPRRLEEAAARERLKKQREQMGRMDPERQKLYAEQKEFQARALAEQRKHDQQLQAARDRLQGGQGSPSTQQPKVERIIDRPKPVRRNRRIAQGERQNRVPIHMPIPPRRIDPGPPLINDPARGPSGSESTGIRSWFRKRFT